MPVNWGYGVGTRAPLRFRLGLYLPPAERPEQDRTGVASFQRRVQERREGADRGAEQETLSKCHGGIMPYTGWMLGRRVTQCIPA